MTTVKVRLEDSVLQHARDVAKERGYSLDEVIAYALESLYVAREVQSGATDESPDASRQRIALRRLLARPHPPAPVISLEAMDRESIYN